MICHIENKVVKVGSINKYWRLVKREANFGTARDYATHTVGLTLSGHQVGASQYVVNSITSVIFN